MGSAACRRLTGAPQDAPAGNGSRPAAIAVVGTLVTWLCYSDEVQITVG